MGKDREPKNISRRNFMVRTAMGGAGLVIANEILSDNLQAVTPKTANATMIGERSVPSSAGGSGSSTSWSESG